MKRLLFLLFVLCFGSGCVSTERVQQLEKQVDELSSKMAYLADENQEYRTKLDEIIKEISSLKGISTTGNKEDKLKADPPGGLKSNTQCKAITQKGTQCTRTAQTGSEYCWQHQGYKGNSSGSIDNSSKEIMTGPRGGQYYINSNGKKTYIKKKK